LNQCHLLQQVRVRSYGFAHVFPVGQAPVVESLGQPPHSTQSCGTQGGTSALFSFPFAFSLFLPLRSAFSSPSLPPRFPLPERGEEQRG
jgi:hypothetical protein